MSHLILLFFWRNQNYNFFHFLYSILFHHSNYNNSYFFNNFSQIIFNFFMHFKHISVKFKSKNVIKFELKIHNKFNLNTIRLTIIDYCCKIYKLCKICSSKKLIKIALDLIGPMNYKRFKKLIPNFTFTH